MDREVMLLNEPIAPDTDAGLGALETPQGRLPLVALDVRAQISGLTTQVNIRQQFRNALDEPIEATYIFPLPDRAAVTSFKLIVADRVVEGDLRERLAAREAYDEAIAAGHRAAIAEEERSGVFTMRVGNLPPHETAHVELTLVGPIPVVDGEATFRFPLVVAPRYTPGIALDGESVGLGTTPDTDATPDASRVTPPVLLPGFPNPVRLAFEVELDPAGLGDGSKFQTANVRSSLHAIISESGPPFRIRLNSGERLDRDFVLRFPVAGRLVQSALQVSLAEGGAPGTFAVTIVPPAASTADQTPRDIVFLLDRSGSMGGWKMVAARRALGRIVDTLAAEDRFAVLAFDTAVDPWPQSGNMVSGTDRDRWQAVEWLGKVEARGGTEIEPALANGLKRLRAQKSAERAAEQILVLITDGQVTNEDHLLRQLGLPAAKPLPRIVTVGIDTAVNAGFLRRLADLGGGVCECVESEDRLDAALQGIHRTLASPVLTELRIESLVGELIGDSLTPAGHIDLFCGRPVTLFGRHLSSSPFSVHVRGVDREGRPWQQVVPSVANDKSALLSLWGRAKVRDLEDSYAARGDDALMRQIVSVSLESRVLSRFTAFVAVDLSAVANPGGKPLEIVQPVELPSGWGDTSIRLCRAFGAAPAGGAGMIMAKRRSASRGGESVDAFLLDEVEETIGDIEHVFDVDYSTANPWLEEILSAALGAGVSELRIETTDQGWTVRHLVNGNWIFIPDLLDSGKLEMAVGRVKQLANLGSLDTQSSGLVASVIKRVKSKTRKKGSKQGGPAQGQFVFTVKGRTLEVNVELAVVDGREQLTLTLLPMTAGAKHRKAFWK